VETPVFQAEEHVEAEKKTEEVPVKVEEEVKELTKDFAGEAAPTESEPQEVAKEIPSSPEKPSDPSLDEVKEEKSV